MKFFAAILLAISTMISGCVAVVVAGAAAGLIVYDKRSMRVLESDARIFHLINKAVVSEPSFKYSHISIVSFNQVVLLIGQTPSASARLLAEKIAHRTPGVRRVYNEISIGHPLGITEITKDSVLTARVRSEMLNKKGLESGSIRVVTENNVVYLMGIATHEQADLAVAVARHIDGVNKVVKIFQYT